MRTTPSILAAVVACLALEATAASYVGAGQVIIGPWFAPYGTVVPPTIHDSFGRCLSPRDCSDYEQMRRFFDRYQRNYGARFAPDQREFAVPAPAARRPTDAGSRHPARLSGRESNPARVRAGGEAGRAAPTDRKVNAGTDRSTVAVRLTDEQTARVNEKSAQAVVMAAVLAGLVETEQ